MNWSKIPLNDRVDKKDLIKSQKEKLIRFSDHGDEHEGLIDLLMDLEINQDDHSFNQSQLKRRIEKLEGIIEFLVDNYDINLKDMVNEKWFVPKSFQRGKAGFGGTMNSNGNKEIITEEMWREATKQRRREERLGEILDKDKKKGN